MRAATRQSRIPAVRKLLSAFLLRCRSHSPAALHGDGMLPFLVAGLLFGLLIAIAGPAGL